MKIRKTLIDPLLDLMKSLKSSGVVQRKILLDMYNEWHAKNHFNKEEAQLIQDFIQANFPVDSYEKAAELNKLLRSLFKGGFLKKDDAMDMLNEWAKLYNFSEQRIDAIRKQIHTMFRIKK